MFTGISPEGPESNEVGSLDAEPTTKNLMRSGLSGSLYVPIRCSCEENVRRAISCQVLEKAGLKQNFSGLILKNSPFEAVKNSLCGTVDLWSTIHLLSSGQNTNGQVLVEIRLLPQMKNQGNELEFEI